MGFFWHNGELGLKRRAKFAEMFTSDKIQKMVPDMLQILQKALDKFKSEHWKENMNETQRHEFKMKVMAFAFQELTDYTLLGDVRPQIDGVTVTIKIVEYINLQTALSQNLAYMLSLGYLDKLGLIPLGRKIKKMQQDVFEASMKTYNKRKAEFSHSSEVKTFNVIDQIIKLNLKA